MEQEPNFQLVFTNDSITLNANLFKGVFVTKTFIGSSCHTELVDFLKQSFGSDLTVSATIIVR